MKVLITSILIILSYLFTSFHHHALADQVHRVQPRETLSEIARNYEIELDSLLRKNRYIRTPHNIRPGQIIIIPQKNYIVQSGDTLYKISQKLGKPMSLIIEANNITDINTLIIGQSLRIPNTYTVQAGDTLFKISSKLGIRMEFLISENNLENKDSLNVGQKLYLPDNDDFVFIERFLTPVANRYPNNFYFKGTDRVPSLALTFDDGPHPQFTGQILDELKKYNVKATFFLLGTNIRGREEIVKRIVAEGHTIANHTWSHPDIRTLNHTQLLSENQQFEQELMELTGLRPTLFRPPYGFYNEANIQALTQQNYKLIQWSVDSFDWRDRNIDNVFLNLIPGIRPGSIMLLHDITTTNNNESLAANLLPELIETMLGQGYRFVTVDEILGISPYK